jgi:hypothetical protein
MFPGLINTPLDHVVQLTHVSGPQMLSQRIEASGVKPMIGRR